MVEINSYIADIGDNEYAVVYPAIICDGYFTDIELWILTSDYTTLEHAYAYFGKAVNEENLPDENTGGILTAQPLGKGFYLGVEGPGSNVTPEDPASQFFKKYFGKRKFYVKAKDQIMHYLRTEQGATEAIFSVMRARFVPQRGSLVHLKFKDDAMEEQSDLGLSAGNKAFHFPVSMYSGSKLKVNLTIVEENGTPANAHGNIVIRHFANNGFLPDLGDSAEVGDHVIFESFDTALPLQTPDREVISVQNWSVNKGEVKTGSYVVDIPTKVTEGDMLIFEFIITSANETLSINVSGEIMGRATGHSQYQYILNEGTLLEDLTEVSD